jgi:8-oxo-dGTP pyrophosphatase MutT (NUDIX family)
LVVAAVCLRRIENEIQVLLVKTSSGRRYGFPKGHQEEHETPVGTAVRELEQEAGWTGKVVSGLVYRLYGLDEKIQGYALVTEAKQCGDPEPGREPAWFKLGKAVLKLQENRSPEEAMPLLLALRQAQKWYSTN